MLRPSFKNPLERSLNSSAYVFTDFHITSYSGFQVKQSVVAVLMFWEQYFLLCSGERMASISVLPVYESLNFPLVCVFACIVWLVFIMVKLTMGYTKITAPSTARTWSV